MSYRGPATLRVDDLAVEVEVDLRTDDSENVMTWGGRASATDLAALGLVAGRCSGTLTLPDGRQGVVYVAHAEPDVQQGGVQLRLHGSGPGPY